MTRLHATNHRWHGGSTALPEPLASIGCLRRVNAAAAGQQQRCSLLFHDTKQVPTVPRPNLLPLRCVQGTDWRDDKHWSCNDCVHPSRSGTYDGITMHPFETVFVKSSWHVGEPFTSHYTKWFMGHALGQVRTLGVIHEQLKSERRRMAG